MARKLLHVGFPLLLSCSAVSIAGCETSDPCLLRQASCLDLTLLGKKEPVSYKGLTVTLTSATGSTVSMTEQIPELQSTAPAGVQTILTFRLPEAFNQLPDLTPDKVVAELPDAEKVTKLESLRMMDARAIHIVVQGTEVTGNLMKAVKWDSKDEDARRYADAMSGKAPDLWLHRMYFRVGKNKYEQAEATLDPVP